MVACIIDLDVMLASLEIVGCPAKFRVGRAQVIAKRASVIAVDSWLDIQHSSWYITWMVTATTLIYAISELCV